MQIHSQFFVIFYFIRKYSKQFILLIIYVVQKSIFSQTTDTFSNWLANFDQNLLKLSLF